MSESEPTQEGLPTLHHLDRAQSQRVLWLLEELKLSYPNFDYNLVIHHRIHNRAPPSLKKIQQLGRAPILVTSTGETLIETPTIIAYLLKTYDPSGHFASSDWIRDETLTSFAASSLGIWNALALSFTYIAVKTPWPLNYLTHVINNSVQRNAFLPEMTKSMEYLTTQLGDREWFNGDHMGRCDFMLSWPIDSIAQWKWVDFENGYPEIYAWRQRVLERPAWKEGIEKGNGYDLTSMT